MKKLIVPLMALTAIIGTSCEKSGNPLLSDYKTPFNTIPFEKIKLEHYVPAFEKALAEARTEMDVIIDNPEAATFENTIEAMDRSGVLLGNVANAFFPLLSAETSDEMEAIAQEIQPLLTEYSNDISLNPKLFERVKTVYNNTDKSKLTTEQQTLLDKSMKSFVRSGANLNEVDKAKYRELTAELGKLTLQFGNNVLGATNAFLLNIPQADSAKVAELPAFAREALAETAASKEQTGWTVTLHAPSMVPFMTYSTQRELKEQVWKAYNSRAYKGEFDNSENVLRITGLRLQIANLMGYATYADYVLEERMIGGVANANAFLDRLYNASQRFAVQDYEMIQNYAREQTGDANFTLMPWDFGYYDEKYKTEKYSINEELLKPYFKLENVRDAVFMLSEKLYGLTYKPNHKIQKYHPEVEVFEVYDQKGKFMAVLYMDYFPRESKKGGAWMTSFEDMYTTAEGTEVRPHVSICCNFTKPTKTTPSLLTFDEVTTLLHEFGHGIHGMLAEGQYASLTGTAVYRDFVELPSQLLENWATEKEFLDMWAVHYETGEKIPAELIQKLLDAKHYLAAYANSRQLTYAMLDLAYHGITEPIKQDVAAFEVENTAKTWVVPRVDGGSFSTGFSHIFAGGYAAGYYSYKWSEALEADAFSVFKEKGVFSREVADSFRENVLSKGGSEDPMKLYVRFRGQEPSVDALIRKMGLDPNAE